jgi:hypothetical protein
MALPPYFPEFRYALARRLSPEVIQVEWSLLPTNWDMGDLGFAVFRSQAPGGPWEQIADVPAGVPYFADLEAPSANMGIEWFYIIRIASKGGHGYRDSKYTHVEHDLDPRAAEVIRRKRKTIKLGSGLDTVALLRRRWGPRCSRCYNHQANWNPWKCPCPGRRAHHTAILCW